MKDHFPGLNSPYSHIQAWIDSLRQLASLQPKQIVPSHGTLADASSIEDTRLYLTQLQSRVDALMRQGVSSEDAAATLTTEFEEMHPDWRSGGGPNAIARAVTAVYRRAN